MPRNSSTPLRNIHGLTWRSPALGLLLVMLALPALVHVQRAAALPNAWSAAASMASPRSYAAATVLASGRVLISGGDSAPTSAEIYDPVTNSWSAAGTMAAGRFWHTSTLLTDGRVLVTGGTPDNGAAVATAEIYDPSSNNWSSAGSLTSGRFVQTATLLNNGKVLVAGGYPGAIGYHPDSLSDAELYDPTSNTWATVAPMVYQRQGHTATLLQDGRVLVAGGHTNSIGYIGPAEIFDPTTNTWSLTGSLSMPRNDHAAVLLPSGKVLIVAGYAAGVSAVIYDPGTGSFSATGDLALPRHDPVASLLPTGQVLVEGGGWADTELYTPSTGLWSSVGAMSAARDRQTASNLLDGRVLVAGGSGVASAELYEPCVEMDCDGFLDPQQLLHVGPANTNASFDNCSSGYNPAQTNTDGNFIDNLPPYGVDDKTWIDSDAAGDACDPDDDNDGISDSDEGTGATCGGKITNPLLADTDGDRALDRAECVLGSDPTSTSIKPTLAECGVVGDADGDRISDRVEFCYYDSNPLSNDTDGDKSLDGALDGCEVASFNVDRIVNVADMGMLATAISNPAFRIVNVDVNKDGAWNPADQGIVASFISPAGQCP